MGTNRTARLARAKGYFGDLAVDLDEVVTALDSYEELLSLAQRLSSRSVGRGADSEAVVTAVQEVISRLQSRLAEIERLGSEDDDNEDIKSHGDLQSALSVLEALG